MTNKKLVLIDGSSFLYRAYYGLQPLHTATGQTVQAVYGFCRMIRKLIATLPSEHVVLVWDSKGPTLRHALFEQYKATRQAPPSDLFEQKKYIQQFAELIGLTQIEQPGVEADDLIGSLAHLYAAQQYEIIVVSSDKDLSQLLSQSITIYDSFKERTLTPALFEQEYGFAPAKVPFYYALLGDSSDNIPGVKGIGKKGALDLIQQFESLEDLYNRIDEVSKERTRQALVDNKANAFLSLELFMLRDVPVAIAEQQLVFDPAQWGNARPLFQELGFKSFLKDIDQQNSADNTPVITVSESLAQKYTFSCVTSLDELKQVLEAIRQAGVVAVDTETSGLDPRESHLVGISLCCAPGQAWYIPLAHQQECLSIAHVIELVKPLLEDQAVGKIMHNAKFDVLMLRTADIRVRGLIFDTMVAASLIVPDWQSIGLKNLSQAYFDEHMATYKEMVEQQGYSDFSQVPIAQAAQYAAADAHQTLKLWHVLREELREKNLEKLYQTIEHPLIEVLCAMEHEGMCCDAVVLNELEHEVAQQLAAIEQEIYGLTGTMPGTLNLNSPKQLEQLLFGTLQLPPQKKSAKKTGYSTDQEVLEVLAELHAVPRLILRYRELAKLRSTYLAALPETISKKTGKIHTSLSQTNVATGRLASTHPNLQNIPVQTGTVTVRSAFKAPIGYTLISADYSQIELRVLAHLSQDPQLKAAFVHERDIHTQTAAALFELPLDQITHVQRQMGKRINFSIMYGLTPYGLARDLKISPAEAKTYIEKFFAQYAQVQVWMEQVVEQTKHAGYTTTFFGRKRSIPGIYEKNRSLFEAARRVAINTPAQGTAAEIMKLGMIQLHEKLIQNRLDAAIVLQVHDELLIMAADSVAIQVADLAKKTLERAVEWSVPLTVNVRTGKSWQEVTK